LHVSRLTWVTHSAPTRFRVRDYHALWCPFPEASASKSKSYRGPTTPQPLAWQRFGLLPFRSPLLPQGTEMFHFPWLAPSNLFIQLEVTPLFAVLGFPIRTSPDQRSVDSSPELFAATHVLHRLLAPRHPPHALSSLLALISFRPTSRRTC
jgi:hypothetical protein